MKRYLSLILAIAATVSAQIVPSTGNVRGPTSATDNAVARYDGTTGKLIQNSGVTIDDSGNLTVSGTGTSSVAGVFKAGTDIVAVNTAAFQVHNNVDDKPMVGFYRGGTLRSVLRLNTDNDFRLLSSDLSTPANLTVGNLTVSGTGTSTFAGNVAVTGTGTNYTAIDTGSFVKFGNNQTSSNLQVGAQGFGGVIQGAQSGSAAYNILAQPYGGNVIIGTTTDTGGRLVVDKASQAADSNTSTSAITVANLAGGNAVLDIGVSSTYLGYVQTRNYTTGSYYQLNLQPAGGNVLIGTTSDSTDRLQVNGSILASPSGAGYLVFTRHGSQNTGLYYNGSQGLVFYTNTSIAMTLSATQALRLNGYGAGTLTTDSSGNVTATSDERAKNITGTFTKGLAEVVKLTPKRYTWKQETGLNTTDEVASLTAQDLIAAGIPEAVSTYRTVADLNDDGTPKLDAGGKPVTKRIDATYTVSDRAVIAALVNAIKELNAKVAALEAARN